MRGMIIRGRWHTIDWIKDNYVCRKCGTRIGKPWADPVTGKLDFDRIVCANEHEITQEGDVISANIVAMRDAQSNLNKIEVLRNYGIDVEVDPALYVDKNWEGF